MSHYRRSVYISGQKLPKSPYGTDFLLFDRLDGVEKLNELFEYTVTVRAQNQFGEAAHGNPDLSGYVTKAEADAGGAVGAHWNLQSVIGSLVNVAIELDGKVDAPENGFGVDIERMAGEVLPAAMGKGKRHINGLVRRIQHHGEQGRHHLYTLTLVPWFWLLTKTSDFRIYQHQSVTEIIDTVLKKYPYPVETRYTGSYPQLDFQVQLGETDHHFLVRLMQEHGLSYHFEHKEGSHILVISDNVGSYQPMDSQAYQEIYVYPPHLKLREEYISQFNPAQSLTTGQVRLSDYQFKQPTADQAITANDPWDTAHNQLEVYEWHQGDYLTAGDGGKDKVNWRVEEHRQHGYRAQGSGHLRGIQTGHTFKLKNHPNTESNRAWLVLGTQYHIRDISQESGDHGAFEVKADFIVQPDNEQVRPDRTLSKPHAPTQTATVVGPKDKEVWTDPYGRVKVKFHWHRNDPNDENSSCWVRVVSPWAGSNYGGIHIPRIGQEVVIDFFSADADMPYISGRLTNPDHMPLWNLPSQHALSGFKSKEIDGSQNNHLIMDDTNGQIQVQLTSDHQLSQLNLGYITRIPDVSGRQDYRGQGFELRTDGWGALRTAMGLMLTTYARSGGSSHLKDLSETIGILKGAQSQHKAFAELAIEHKADERTIDETAQTELKQQNEEVGGHKGEGEDKFPELTAPHLVLSSPAGIELATPKSLHIATEEHTAITSSKDTSLSVAGKLVASVAKGINFFTQTMGIKAFAAKGKVEIQAQSDNIEIIADQIIKIISAKKKIEIAAAEEILLTAKGSYIKINAQGIEHGTPANWVAWAASHSLPGPKQDDYTIPSIGAPFLDQGFQFYDERDGQVLHDYPSWVKKEDGEMVFSRTKKDGTTPVVTSKKSEYIESYEMAQLEILVK